MESVQEKRLMFWTRAIKRTSTVCENLQRRFQANVRKNIRFPEGELFVKLWISVDRKQNWIFIRTCIVHTGWLNSIKNRNERMWTFELNKFFRSNFSASTQYTGSNDMAIIFYHLCDNFLEAIQNTVPDWSNFFTNKLFQVFEGLVFARSGECSDNSFIAMVKRHLCALNWTKITQF